MSKYRVLYIDDDASKHGFSQIEPMIDTLEENESIEIIPLQSGPFDKISSKLLELVKEYDAIIFDYQLDDRANDEGETGNVKAPVLAQHLRTEATNSDRDLKDVPFILCSTDDKLQKSYTTDHTSHDLFDLRFRKDKEDLLLVSKQIVALIEGYQTIKKAKNLDEVVGIDIDLLDDRIFSRFITNNNTPPHELARTILKDLIYTEGPLIGEKTLAARLGIDRQSKDFQPLMENQFSEAKYKGAFKNGWNRWWMTKINDIFRDIVGSNLASLDATERVEKLKEATKLKKLSVAERIEGCSSYRYWTVCKSYDKPLDPREGFRAASKVEPKPWQDYGYISKHGAINRIGFEEGLKVHPSEQERYRLLIEELKKGK